MINARDSCPPPAQQNPSILSLWSPVSPDEVRNAFPEQNTAPGSDGEDVAQHPC
ncbi:hypothetical protein K0M31_012654 [Melipona bicolor]|uniref:Uncharacterized protein n=1 Tax=Melipona bicolor TaxID=60889 RepID=A0AA40FK58_9HYME|nr:hypothetical protein K0M31_012654 [Melipona bicolor]